MGRHSRSGDARSSQNQQDSDPPFEPAPSMGFYPEVGATGAEHASVVADMGELMLEHVAQTTAAWDLAEFGVSVTPPEPASDSTGEIEVGAAEQALLHPVLPDPLAEQAQPDAGAGLGAFDEEDALARAERELAEAKARLEWAERIAKTARRTRGLRERIERNLAELEQAELELALLEVEGVEVGADLAQAEGDEQSDEWPVEAEALRPGQKAEAGGASRELPAPDVHTMGRIADRMTIMRFRKRLFGVDEADVWKKIDDLRKEYEAAFRAQEMRYQAEMDMRHERERR